MSPSYSVLCLVEANTLIQAYIAVIERGDGKLAGLVLEGVTDTDAFAKDALAAAPLLPAESWMEPAAYDFAHRGPCVPTPLSLVHPSNVIPIRGRTWL